MNKAKAPMEYNDRSFLCSVTEARISRAFKAADSISGELVRRAAPMETELQQKTAATQKSMINNSLNVFS